MELIRGWESEYAPNVTGGLRLRKARLYRDMEEEGLGDAQEGEIRVNTQAEISMSGSEFASFPTSLSVSMEPDGPEFEVKDLMPGETRKVQYDQRVEDSALGIPFLFCLSRQPITDCEWNSLQAALPERYDTWTVTEDVCGLKFEIEWGIRRWMALNGITQHRIDKYWGWVTYSYDTTPPSVDPSDIGQVLEARWFRKSRRFSSQQEYRLAWLISSPQMETLPDCIDIELTRTGLALFKPWTPQW